MREIEETQKIFICHKFILVMKTENDFFYLKKYSRVKDAIDYADKVKLGSHIVEIFILKGGYGWGHTKIYERKKQIEKGKKL